MTDPLFYISSDGNEVKQNKLNELGSAYQRSENLVTASIAPTSFSDPNIDVRPQYHRLNYEDYRQGDAIPTNDASIMRSCRMAYEQVGLIRSVVDLMTEMAVEGLVLESTNESINNFYKNWSKRVHLQDRAERFANHFLVEGNVVCRRKVGGIDTAEVRRLRRSQATHNMELEIEPGILPIDYIFYDPSTIQLIGEELAVFAGVKQWAIVINNRTLARLARVPPQDRENLMRTLPEEIRQLIKNNNVRRDVDGKFLIPIPINRVYVEHNKKLDSRIWAKSFIYSILHDVIYNEKLRVAKISALDGWHNSLRIWKLGDHNAEVFPSSGSFSKLADILKQHPGGVLDILWDSMISMEPFYPPIEKLDNFNENFESMMLGLGVPRILVGGSEGAGVTNMFVGMKNLMKRINGIRRALIEWVEYEIKIISDNLGFRDKPKIRFSYQDLFDNQTFFKLLTDLYDRQLISDQSVLEKIGEHADIQRKNMKEEHDLRAQDQLAPGNGPFWQPRIPQQNQDFQLEKEEESFKRQKEMVKLQPKPVAPGDNSNKTKAPPKTRGRPPGSKDQGQRNRRFRAKSQLLLLADQIQDKIDGVLDKQYLVYNNVKNKRQLTSEQKRELEQVKLELLASCLTTNFDGSDIENVLAIADQDLVNEFVDMYHDSVQTLGPNVTMQQIRMLKNQIFAEMYIND